MVAKGKRGWSMRRGVVVLGVGLLAGALGLLPRPLLDVRWEVPVLKRDVYVPNARHEPGQELVFVVIGSSSCAWSRLSETANLVREARDSLVARTEASHVTLATVGVAKDNIPERGIRHLRRFGRFDEVMTGRGWRNAGVLRYIYNDFPGPAVTPQVLVIARELARSGGQWEIADERVLVRKAGLLEIRRWVNGGSGIPQDASPLSVGS